MFGLTRAPEIDRAGLVWFNVDAPLTLEDLRGRLVILDFWTFCCINCMHVLPTLRRIEEAHPDEVVVIGIHSPKFQAERDARNVAQAIARYDIRHPVAHDPWMGVWQDYVVRAWPTLVFVSPDGHVIGQMAGEPNPDLLMKGVDEMLAEFRDRGEMSPRALALSPPAPTGGRLRFPGKIKPAPGESRAWAVADAGHHQIALFDDGGAEVARWGSGVEGFIDGPAGVARFRGPQGLVCDDLAIYVADTGNHAIRRIDRASGAVTTLAGTGSRGAPLTRRQRALGADLASPWDLELLDRRLFFANAGTHQIGEIDLDGGEMAPLAGTGGENIVDGQAGRALLAQPSGLALDVARRVLYVADSETSAIRRVTLDSDARVDTLVGTGLFDFGLRDGPLAEAQLQHPLGVALDGRRLWVADSYNGAIRLIDLDNGTMRGLDAIACADPVCIPEAEPAGVWAEGDRLLLADTNNHRILEYRLDEGARRTWVA
ncbi:MAG: redoxin domain-containing protein [Alphaproteobacteria bacterium]|nr:redoxin domain-containing protein [Alphaproteobacteria bacterium]